MTNEKIKQTVKRIYELRWYLNEALKDPSIRICDMQEELEQLKKDIITILDYDKNDDESLTNACLDVINALKINK